MKIKEPGRRIMQFLSLLLIGLGVYYTSIAETGLKIALSTILLLMGVALYNQSCITHLENKVKSLE